MPLLPVEDAQSAQEQLAAQRATRAAAPTTAPSIGPMPQQSSSTPFFGGLGSLVRKGQRALGNAVEFAAPASPYAIAKDVTSAMQSRAQQGQSVSLPAIAQSVGGAEVGGLTHSFTPPQIGSIPVAGGVLTELGRPANYVPFVPEAGIAGNVVRNVAGALGGQAASGEANRVLPQGMNPVARTALVGGAGLAGGAAAYGAAAGLQNAATGLLNRAPAGAPASGSTVLPETPEAGTAAQAEPAGASIQQIIAAEDRLRSAMSTLDRVTSGKSAPTGAFGAAMQERDAALAELQRIDPQNATLRRMFPTTQPSAAGAEPFTEYGPAQEQALRAQGIEPPPNPNPYAGSEIARQGGMTPELQQQYGSLMEDIKQNGWTPENIKQYADMTGRDMNALLNTPPNDLPRPLTPDLVRQMTGNAVVRGETGLGGTLPESVPLRDLQQGMRDAENSVAQQADLNRALRSRQYGGMYGALENGPGGTAGLKSALGAMRGPGERATFTPLTETMPADSIEKVSTLVGDAIKAGKIGNRGPSAIQAWLDLMSGTAPTRSGLQALGDVLGPETSDSIKESLRRMGVKYAPSLAQRINESPVMGLADAVNNTLRTSNTALNLSEPIRRAFSTGLYDPEVYYKTWGNAMASVATKGGPRALVQSSDAMVNDALTALAERFPNMPKLTIDDFYDRGTGGFGLVRTNPESDIGLLSSERLGKAAGAVAGKVAGEGAAASAQAAGEQAGTRLAYFRTWQRIYRPQMLVASIENKLNAGELTPEQLNDPAVLKDLGREVNMVSGHASFRLGGQDANFLFQFPNWLSANIEIAGRGIAGIAKTAANVVPGVNVPISYTDAAARTIMGRLITIGLGATWAANAAQGIGPSDPKGWKNGIPVVHVPNGVASALNLPKNSTVNLFGKIGTLVDEQISAGRAGFEAATGGSRFGGGIPQKASDRLGGFIAALGGQEFWNYRTQAAGLNRIAADWMTGSDVVGNPTHNLTYPVKTVAPFAAGSAIEGDRSAAGQVLSGLGVPIAEPSAARQLNDIVQQQYASQIGPGGVEPYMIDQIRQQHPALTATALGKARASTKAWDAAKAQANTEQQTNDQQLLDGKITWQQWTGRKADTQHELSGKYEVIYPPNTFATDPNAPWQVYSQIIKQNTDPKTGATDWNAVDAWRQANDAKPYGTTGQTWGQVIDRNIGLNDTPLEAARRKVENALSNSGYYDFGQNAWQKVESAYSTSAPDYQTWYQQQLDKFKPLFKNDADPTGAAELAIGRLPQAKAYTTLLGNARDAWIHAHPDLAQQATQYGLLQTSQNVRTFLNAWNKMSGRPALPELTGAR